MFKHIINFIFPLTCGSCGKLLKADNRRRICDECWSRIAYSRSRVFPLPSWLDDIYTCCSYEGVIRECIHVLKYRARGYMAAPLGAIMADCLEGGIDIDKVDIIAPVPLHRKSRDRRGFNQSELLIKEISKKYGREVSLDNLIRKQNTRSQVTLLKDDRVKNVEGAFHVRNPDLFTGRSILVVDDVCTTGSTLNECAKSLKKAGALKVYGLVLAHGS